MLISHPSIILLLQLWFQHSNSGYHYLLLDHLLILMGTDYQEKVKWETEGTNYKKQPGNSQSCKEGTRTKEQTKIETLNQSWRIPYWGGDQACLRGTSKETRERFWEKQGGDTHPSVMIIDSRLCNNKIKDWYTWVLGSLERLEDIWQNEDQRRKDNRNIEDMGLLISKAWLRLQLRQRLE